MRFKTLGLGIAFLWGFMAFPDGAQGATFVVTNTNNSGAGSLRQAILSANVTLGSDTIVFNIPGAGPHTIKPLSPLPIVTDPVIIDGTTQPGFAGSPIIELDGTNAGSSADGLSISAGNSTVRGLVIDRFGGSGIFFRGPGGNAVTGNHIGTDVSGNSARANGRDGVYIRDSSSNLIGGTTKADRNVISGNKRHGVHISGSGAKNNRVQGNFIGTGADGTNPLGNNSFGVGITAGASNNTTGGTQKGAGNVISANGITGVAIRGSGTNGNRIQGNKIGVAVDGNTAIANRHGVQILGGAQNNNIGPGNVISGNAQGGVEIGGSGTNGNTVIGNTIGLRADGTALGNGINGDGVTIAAGGQNNRVGGTTPGQRNVISGNAFRGIAIINSSSNVVQGNYIGISIDGMSARPNSQGIGIVLGSQNLIGGKTPGAGNVISGNTDPSIVGTGIRIEGVTSTGNRVQGNLIGTNASGNAAIGNSWYGVHIFHAPNNTVGGPDPGEGNTISGNGEFGVMIDAISSQNNVVQGNFIGTNASSIALGNGGGVAIFGDASNNTVGGTASGAGNTIAHSVGGSSGVAVPFGTGNAILSNRIFSNTGLGIDIGPVGVTDNDLFPGDADTGANNLQNYPVLTSAISDGISTTIKGTLNSVFNTTFRLEFFASAVADPSGHGEGEKFIGSGAVTSDGGGNASFTFTFPVGVPPGHAITATATRQAAPTDTSEFSKRITVGPL